MNFVIFDMETTGLSAASDEIIEIGAVRWVNGQCGETFHTLVKPTKAIPDDILSLLNQDSAEDLITEFSFDEAPDLETALPKFLTFIAGHHLVGHNIQFDLQFLMRACEDLGYDLPTSVDTLDTLTLSRVLLPFERDHRLIDVAQCCNVPVEVSHRALSDALTTAGVLTALRDRALKFPYLTLQHLEQLSGLFSPITAAWFHETSDLRYQAYGVKLPDYTDSIQQLVFANIADSGARLDGAETAEKNPKPRSDRPIEVIDASSRLLDHDSPLKSVLPGFEVRAGQRQMVEAVANALEGDQHLIVEAGTGTGKSLAYLIPAALYATLNDTRVVVSTHTIALQDQIHDRDFSTLRTVVDRPLTLTIFKGRTHYVCMRKLLQEVRGLSFANSRAEIEAYMSLLCWLTETPEGNREELSLHGRMADIWPRIQSETETCINKRCPFFKSCYYFRARSKAYEADVIVTNHSLVFSDLKADHRVLPRYDKLILDEAHHLEEEATKHLGDEVHLFQCLALLGRLARDNGRHGVLPELLHRLEGSNADSVSAIPVLERLVEQLRTLRSLIEDAFTTLGQLMPAGHQEFRVTRSVEGSPAWRKYLVLADEMMRILGLLTEQQNLLQDAAELESDQDLGGRLFDAHGFLFELVGHTQTLCSAGDLSDDWVVWIERAGQGDRTQLSLHRAPIDVARILSDTLFDTKSTVVLTSATLSVDGDFDYIKTRLGLTASDQDGRLEALTVPSPFEFGRQALLCVPNDVPELAKMDASEAATWLSDSIYQLAKASDGRLLALFTSHAMLRATESAIREPLGRLGIRTYAQGVDGSRTRILDNFRNHPKSVLLGAQSFWEGIDLPGDQLTTLVIVRLPFAPPSHPVTEARHQRLEQQGQSAFWSSSLPDAVVRFRQGFGRLIRTINDRGVVVVYDKRIITAKYGMSFIRSIPGVKPVVATEKEVISHVRSFLYGSPAGKEGAPSAVKASENSGRRGS